jgi:hypothetical protein
VPIPHQITDQATVVADFLRPFAVADASSLDYGGVIAHVIDQPDEAVVEAGAFGVR